jgi:hypothetical protein
MSRWKSIPAGKATETVIFAVMNGGYGDPGEIKNQIEKGKEGA